MLRKLGFDPQYTQQERITRKALFLTWLIIALMPLPVCFWVPIPGLLYYILYLIPVSFGLKPLFSKSLKRKFIFHWLFCGAMAVVACDGSPLKLPFMFVMQCVYFMYWQLENRLYAIREALKDYDFDDIKQDDSPEMVKNLVWSVFKKAFLPALAGSLCCLLAYCPPGWVGVCITLPVFLILYCVMRDKLKVFSKF